MRSELDYGVKDCDIQWSKYFSEKLLIWLFSPTIVIMKMIISIMIGIWLIENDSWIANEQLLLLIDADVQSLTKLV